MRLGKHQIETLAAICHVGTSYVVPTKHLDALIKKGLMKAASPRGSFVHITADGLRELAAAADAGLVQLAPDLDRMKKHRKGMK